MKPSRESILWPTVSIAVIALGISFIAYVAFPLPDSKLMGGFLFAIGVFNLLFSRMLGSRVYGETVDRPVLGWFWLRCGEKGSQYLFLGIAVTLVIAGCLLVIFGAA
jgi:hypothetical protein